MTEPKTIGTGDTQIDRDDAILLRDQMIALRDEALKQQQMVARGGALALILSHVIAFMGNAIEEIWGSK